MASSRGQSSPIIAPQKLNLLPFKDTKTQQDAEKSRSRDDYVEDSNFRINRDFLATASIEPISESASNYFSSCQASLSKSSYFNSEVKKLSTSKSINNLGEKLSKETGCLTELHCGSSEKTQSLVPVDEVEIVSLLEEQIPRYKLRADAITKFSGYQNEDFVGVPYPVLTDYSPVTPEQAYLTLGYFLLSGVRVSQMTKTYSDVDAVQRLLEEKEKDLELAARIGQQLLEENLTLKERYGNIESEYKESIETITQLKHELLFKSQLLELYNDNTPSEENSKAGTPIGSVASVLERRVALLESENQNLRTEAVRIVECVEKTEAEEKYLIDDAIKRLNETNSRSKQLSDELQKKTEECSTQQDEIITLIDNVKILQSANKELYEDNISLQESVESLKSAQNELSSELIDLKENYIEVVGILKETQEQLREAQKQKESGADVISVFDSLAYEIESSVAKQRRSSDYFRRCFDTVRSVNSKCNDSMMSNSNMLSSGASSGYLSGFSGQPSFDSSLSHDVLVVVNPGTTVGIVTPELNSSFCLSPTTPSDKFSWRMPEKLQIVKPLEGSSTLQVWSSLATPHLGNLLQTQPGVQMRLQNSIRKLDSNERVLALTSPEETGLHNFTSTAPVFTYVTTSNSWSRRQSTTTVYTGELSSTLSTYSSSSRSASPLPTPTTSDSYSYSGLYGGEDSKIARCETPQNSPEEGSSRSTSPIPPTTPTPLTHSPFKPKFFGLGVYETLVSKLSSYSELAASRSSSNLLIGFENKLNPESGSSATIETKSVIGAPVKPGSGVLDKILSDSA